MIIRFAEINDAELLGHLRIAMRKERETSPPPADEKKFLQENINYFKQTIADGSYIGVIAETDGNIAAVGGICLHFHPPSYSVPNGKSACLLNMYTLPEFRGRGIAAKIVDTLVSKAREAGCYKVFLNASDMGKSIYLKYGFTEVANEMVFTVSPE